MATKKVVMNQSSVTAGQMKDLFRQMEQGLIGFREVQDFLESPVRDRLEGRATLSDAVEILGKENVTSATQAAKVWGLEEHEVTLLRYNKTTLQQCARNNRAVDTDFCLVYLHGFSLREQFQHVGGYAWEHMKLVPDSETIMRFYNAEQFEHLEHANWLDQKTRAGYFLVDLNLRFRKMDWDEQEKEIAKLQNFKRIHEAAATEILYLIWRVYDGTIIWDRGHVVGRNRRSDGKRVVVGVADGGCGIQVFDNGSYEDGVAVVRNFTN
jgi:hypothetical protein